MTRTHVLTGSDTLRALEAGGPLVDLQVDPARLAEMSVAAVEVDDRIVAYWVLWKALHLEPLWIAPDHRHSPSVVSGLIGALQQAAEASGEPAGFAVIEEPNLSVIAPYAERLGFLEAPGKLYYLVLAPPVPPAGG